MSMLSVTQANSSFRHCTELMLDGESVDGKKERKDLQKVVAEDPNCDISFSETWVAGFKIAPILDSTSFLKALDTIQAISIKHIPSHIIKNNRIGTVYGRALVYNWFGIYKTVLSDRQGIVDIIDKIWLNREPYMEIRIWDNDGVSKFYSLNSEHFCKVNRQLDTKEVIFVNKSPNKDTVDKIYNIILSFYEQGPCDNGADRIMIVQHSSPEKREQRALKFIDRYFKKINLNQSPTKKIAALARTMQDLMQLHLYILGNREALFILANVLLDQQGLSPFYPRNRYIFDANSMPVMEREIAEGQKRFVQFFGNVSDLNQQLEDYYNGVIDLLDMMQKYQSMDNKK